MSNPNAKICPRCGKVVPLTQGHCDHCARLFRTPLSEEFRENRTIMFHSQDFLCLPPPPPQPRKSALWAWLAGWGCQVQSLLSYRQK